MNKTNLLGFQHLAGLFLSESGFSGLTQFAGLQTLNRFYPENRVNPVNPDSDSLLSFP
ncbi:hypothetical protein BegalDRAFT_1575 [Beggiatoa alba B18LD]|uniref:Uncharacterized protein n=1 Tax=Beggiatoa alba B18LD TaxID=395493 RepID=I3CFR2_9GAMM|nr:hypothetical protein BegalDRAFT_1575 [Beggiatoa alba B18LD]